MILVMLIALTLMRWGDRWWGLWKNLRWEGGYWRLTIQGNDKIQSARFLTSWKMIIITWYNFCTITSKQSIREERNDWNMLLDLNLFKLLQLLSPITQTYMKIRFDKHCILRIRACMQGQIVEDISHIFT